MKKTLLFLLAALGTAQARTITDDLGRQVTLPDAPKRIAALSPFLVEGLYAVGTAPVGWPFGVPWPVGVSVRPDSDSS